MELASLDGMEDTFDTYAADLRKAPLGPWLKSYFLVFFGEGLERFGRYDAARETLTEAVDYATANQIYPAMFRAEEALVLLRSRSRTSTEAPLFREVPQEVLAAAHAISELRKAALVSS
jgi:hypothetical protein